MHFGFDHYSLFAKRLANSKLFTFIGFFVCFEVVSEWAFCVYVCVNGWLAGCLNGTLLDDVRVFIHTAQFEMTAAKIKHELEKRAHTHSVEFVPTSQRCLLRLKFVYSEECSYNSYYLISTFRVDFVFKVEYSYTSLLPIHTHTAWVCSTVLLCIDYNLDYRIVFNAFASADVCVCVRAVLRIRFIGGGDHWHHVLWNWHDLIDERFVFFILLLLFTVADFIGNLLFINDCVGLS